MTKAKYRCAGDMCSVRSNTTELSLKSSHIKTSHSVCHDHISILSLTRQKCLFNSPKSRLQATCFSVLSISFYFATMLFLADLSWGYEPYVEYRGTNTHRHYGYNSNYASHYASSNGYSHYPNTYQTYRKYVKQYLPAPQFCPETGRTVCSNVTPFYPSDEVFSVLKMARAKRFNISSEFVDESENDSEPHFPDVDPVPEPDSFTHPTTNIGFGVGHQHHPHRPTSTSFSLTPSVSMHYHNYDYQQYPVKAHHTKSIYHTYSSDANVYSQQRYKRQSSDSLPVEPICPSRIILLEPKAALNDKRQWKFIVNLSDRDPRLKQAIKVEVCTTPNQPCSNQISLPFGFVSRCKQKYIKKKLISLDASGQSISSENFFAPSCCVCEVTRNANDIGPQSSSRTSSFGDNVDNEENPERKRKK